MIFYSLSSIYSFIYHYGKPYFPMNNNNINDDDDDDGNWAYIG